MLELVVFATHWDIIAFDNSKYLRNNWYFYNLVKGQMKSSVAKFKVCNKNTTDMGIMTRHDCTIGLE